MLIALVTSLLIAQAPVVPEPSSTPTPAPVAPEPLVVPGFRVHVIASETLHADSLGALARRGVVLWLRTSSNALRPSTVEALRRFEEAWVQVRPPVLEGHALGLKRAPAAGVWLTSPDHAVKELARLGIRRIALEVNGPIDEVLATRVTRLNLGRIRWSTSSPDLAGFGQFTQMRGVRELRIADGQSLPACADDGRRSPRKGTSLAVSSVRDAVLADRCGFGVIVQVDAKISDDELGRLLKAVPTAELEVDIGDDDRKAMAVRRLIERLEAASGSVKTPK